LNQFIRRQVSCLKVTGTGLCQCVDIWWKHLCYSWRSPEYTKIHGTWSFAGWEAYQFYHCRKPVGNSGRIIKARRVIKCLYFPLEWMLPAWYRLVTQRKRTKLLLRHCWWNDVVLIRITIRRIGRKIRFKLKFIKRSRENKWISIIDIFFYKQSDDDLAKPLLILSWKVKIPTGVTKTDKIVSLLKERAYFVLLQILGNEWFLLSAKFLWWWKKTA
jgi:hypothetical protein